MNNLNDEIAVVAKTRKNLGDGPNDCPIDYYYTDLYTAKGEFIANLNEDFATLEELDIKLKQTYSNVQLIIK